MPKWGKDSFKQFGLNWVTELYDKQQLLHQGRGVRYGAVLAGSRKRKRKSTKALWDVVYLSQSAKEGRSSRVQIVENPLMSPLVDLTESETD